MDGAARRARAAEPPLTRRCRADPRRPRRRQHLRAPRITAELNDGAPEDERVNHKRVARVMRAAGIVGYRRRRRVTPPSPNRPTRRCRTCSTGISPPPRRTPHTSATSPICRGGGENLYLATVIDCFSRRLVGWAIAEHMRTELVEDASSPPPRCAAAWPARSSTPTTEVSTPQRTSRRSARTGCHPVDGSGRDERRQRAGRVVQRHPQTRRPARPQLLARRGHLPPRGVPVAGPLQHPTPPLLLRLPAPPPTKASTHPLRCPKPRNHKSRVHYMGSRPGWREYCTTLF